MMRIETDYRERFYFNHKTSYRSNKVDITQKIETKQKVLI